MLKWIARSEQWETDTETREYVRVNVLFLTEPSKHIFKETIYATAIHANQIKDKVSQITVTVMFIAEVSHKNYFLFYKNNIVCVGQKITQEKTKTWMLINHLNHVSAEI